MFVRMFKSRMWIYLKENITNMLAYIESNQRKNYVIVHITVAL